MLGLLVASVLLSVYPAAPLAAQQLSALPSAAHTAVIPGLPGVVVLATTRMQSASSRPARWPFVLTGALVGGAIAGGWYAHEASKSGDATVDLSVPVVAIGVAGGAFCGWFVSAVVRSARITSPAT